MVVWVIFVEFLCCEVVIFEVSVERIVDVLLIDNCDDDVAFDVDGDVDDESVGGVVIGSEWAGCALGTSGEIDGIVGVLAT